MTSRVRREHLAMADDRAMEEQMERHNPVNPKELLHNRRENSNRLSGQGGATPSMGLSQYRGGRKHTLQDHLEHPMKGFGTKTGKKMLGMTRNPPSEAFEMGRHLGAHLHQLHGGAFHGEFLHGLSGSGWFDSFKDSVGNAFNKVKNEFVNPDSVLRRGAEDAGKKVAHEFTDPNSILRDKAIPIGAQVAQYASPFIDAVVPGAGTAINYGFKAANYANKGAKMLGYGDDDMRRKKMLGRKRLGRPPLEGEGLASFLKNANASVKALKKQRDGGMVRRMVGSGVGSGMLEEPMPVRGTNLNLSGMGSCDGGADTGAYEGQGKGRSARAAIVKKVMAEKGLKMIEASKYVKAHGLY